MEMNIKHTFLSSNHKMICNGLMAKETSALVLVSYRMNVKVLKCIGIFKGSFKTQLKLQCCSFQKSQNCL